MARPNSSQSDAPATPASRPAYVHAIATAVPTAQLPQDEVRRLLYGTGERSRLAQRLTDTVFAASGVDTRHLFLAQVDQETDMGKSFLDPDPHASPSTSARNDLVVMESRRLAAQAAGEALRIAEIEASEITHVITVSCTGFSAPGVDYTLVRDLDLPASVRRVHLGFMGCCAAFPALSTARSISQAEPNAVVLVVCVEVCSLHLKVGEDIDAIVASSLFADGCAAMVVSARSARAGAAVLELTALGTTLTSVGEQDLTWRIGDNGFEMVLSSKVPRIIEAEVADALVPLADSVGTDESFEWRQVERWAIHPGGPAILDRVEKALGLSSDQLAPSRDILSRYGNMSSTTVPFILKSILADPQAREGERVCALAFGPGLTVESAMMTIRTAA